MEARRRRRNREAAIFIGGGCLIFLVLGAIIVIVGTIMNAVETANVKRIYGETYASTCQSVPEGAESIENLPTSGPPHRLLLLISDTQRRHGWHSDLPPQWQATNEEEVSLIGCVTEQSNLLETCEYWRDGEDSDTAYTVKIMREQYESTLVLVNAQTGRRIDSLTVTGSEPEPCPEDDGSLTSSMIHGAEVAWADFASWTETYIFHD